MMPSDSVNSYTIIILKSVCRCSQTAGRNSCSTISGDSQTVRIDCLSFLSQGLVSVWPNHFVITDKHTKHITEPSGRVSARLQEPATPVTVRSRLIASDPSQPRQLRSQRRQIEPKRRKAISQNGDNYLVLDMQLRCGE